MRPPEYYEAELKRLKFIRKKLEEEKESYLNEIDKNLGLEAVKKINQEKIEYFESRLRKSKAIKESKEARIFLSL
jgi:hypothetical protein